MLRKSNKKIALFSSGEGVRQLQKSLIKSGEKISDEELRRSIFGRSTQAAIKTFQVNNEIAETGLADAKTLALLNPETEDDRLRKGDFSSVAASETTRRVILSLEKLDLSLPVVNEVDSEIPAALNIWRQGKLKQQLVDYFDTPSEELVAAIDAFPVEMDKVKTQTFSTFLFDLVLPELVKDESLEGEIFNTVQAKKITELEAESDDETIDELLNLSGDIRDVPELKPFINTIRNTVFSDIVNLDDEVADKLGDADLLETSAAIIELEKDGTISAGQKNSLLLVADLARLTDDNFKAIRALTNEIRATRDLVSRNQSDWVSFIETNEISPPGNETPESYARILDHAVENAFATAYTLSRYSLPAAAEITSAVPSLDELSDTTDAVFVKGEVRKDLDLSHLPEERIAAVREDLNRLSQFANRYAGLGVADILNDRSRSAREKLQVIERRQTALNQAWTLHPKLDLKYANLISSTDETAEAFRVDLDTIAEEERPHVRRALMSAQRVFQLSDSFDTADKLMAAGLDSASKIAETDDADELSLKTGLSQSMATVIRQRASAVHTHMTHFVHSLEDTAGHAAFNPQILNEATPSSNTDIINVLKDLPGYSELFGPQNYCKCKHCQSIFSPAAYFVDLMNFIHKKISKPNFINKDLEDHPLYLKNRRDDLWSLALTCENTNNTVIYLSIVNEVLENYLATQAPINGDVWEFLATEARSSFQQPYNLPYAQLLLYTMHLGVSLKEITALFSDPQKPAVYSVLGISPQELTTLSNPEIDAIRTRFAKPFTADLSIHDTAILAKLCHVDREILERIWSTTFVSQHLESSVNITSEENDLVGFVEHLHLQVPEGSDEDDELKEFLDRLHRFTRLQRALAWTPEQIQLVIESVQTATNIFPALDSELLAYIAEFKLVKEALGLTVSETIALCHQIPHKTTIPDKPSLWAQLFGERVQLEVRHPRLDNTTVNDPQVSADFGLLQGALRVSEPELIELLNREVAATNLENGVLTEEDLYRLYRFARLAHALEINQQQLLIVFQIVPTFVTAINATERLAAIGEIVKWLNDVDLVSLSLNQVLDVLSNEINDSYGDQAEGVLTAIRLSLKDEEERWLTPKDLSSIEGIDHEASRAIIRELENRDSPWLLQPDPTAERYLLTDAVLEEPDLTTIQESLSTSGGPLADTDDTDHSIKFLSNTLRGELSKHHPAILARAAMAQKLSISGEYLKVFEPLLSHLPSLSNEASTLADWIQRDDVPLPDALLEYTSEVIRLSYLIKNMLELKPDTVEFITQNETLFSITAGHHWQWPDLFRVASLLSSSKQEEKHTAYQQALLSWDGSTFPSSAGSDLATVFEINELQVDAWLNELPPNDSPFVTLQHIAEGVRLSQRTGLDPSALRQLTSTSFAGLSAAADLLLGAMRTKHSDESSWKIVEAPFLEKTAGLKRDALVDRMLSRPELQFENAREIYHFFLLDPEMDGCFLTSPVKNAITSCQLYVQRCLMGLEQESGGNQLRVKVKSGKKSREEWKWRKSYRVWEANRKVFLYPENYMLPDLRDDRSHIFRIAEQELLQGKLDDDSIDLLFKRYITEFVQVGDLEIVHVLYEPSKNFSSGGTYLLFGRTKQEPLRYFMREFNGKERWEPWQPIDLDISARTVSAVRKKGKLYLFWTNVVLNSDADKIKEANSESTSIDASSVSDPESTLASASQTERRVDERTPISIVYSYLNETGSWSSPQNVLFYSLLLNRNNDAINELLPFSNKVYVEYPHPSRGAGGVKNLLRVIHPVNKIRNSTGRGLSQYLGFLVENENKTINRNGTDTAFVATKGNFYNWNMFKTPGFRLDSNQLIPLTVDKTKSTVDVDDLINRYSYQFIATDDDAGAGAGSGSGGTDAIYLKFNNVDISRVWLRAVQRRTSEAVLNLADTQYLIKRTGKPGYPNPNPNSLIELMAALINSKRKLVNLGSGWPEYLSKRIFSKGTAGLLSPVSQTREEPRSFNNIEYLSFGNLRPPDEDLLWANMTAKKIQAQFSGTHGDYLWEIFFHLPVLIAHTFNSQGKFEEADRWFRYVFDPTTSTDKPENHWRFVVFRSLEIPRLREILTQTSAIKTYKKDPFNPYAIARLRPSAFEKNLIMRYIDNLVDWGDSLFGRDTRESINEALLLYVMAADLLGERPIETGECDVADSMTYNDILLRNRGGEFLVELENFMAYFVNQNMLPPIDPDPEVFGLTRTTLSDDETENEPPLTFAVGEGFSVINSAELNFNHFSITRSVAARSLFVGEDDTGTAPTASDDIAFEPVTPDPDPPFEPDFPYAVEEVDVPDPGGPVQIARTLGFCVPPNDTLLGYWDRVEDRLYKLRHCMNIDGVERQLPLWQPPIDPMLLVRAKAAGLSLDDVLASINEQPPFQRFEVLLERARRFTSTVQQLGSQLLSALERKDENELVLLRAVQEDEILSLSRDQKKAVIDEAQKARDHLDKLEGTITLRRNYYGDLLAVQTDLMMNEEELDALTQLEMSKERQAKAGVEESQAQSNREQGPQWSAGLSGSAGLQVPFAPALHPLFARATADASVSWGSFNEEAGYNRRALNHRDASSRHNALAGMSSSKGSYKRRIEEWQFQRSIAQSEIDALIPQKAAADIRIALAEKELEIHEVQIKNSRELYDFAKDRFTNLGLYTYLSTSLSRLHREAYDMAFKMAQLAERAYRFELGDDKFFIKMNNWDSSRAGLLSGDHLLLQLQAMEASFVEKDKRRQEITLPCSLAQINPQALLTLRQTGGAVFDLPEWWFDLYYPGQYRRLLQSVRLTIPCITGPYSNVGAKLTLLDSRVREIPDIDSPLSGVQIGRNSSISTSTANADPGVFELRFEAPKNPPFKGAGANSSWRLQLPQQNRVFDYSTISDVVLELSYTAEDDSLFRQTVEGTTEIPGSLDRQLTQGMTRIVSLRHEFPAEFQRLKSTDPQLSTPVELLLTRSILFPHWIENRSLMATLGFAIEPKTGQLISAADIQGDADITVNSEMLSNWFDAINLGGIPMVASEDEIEIEDNSIELSIATSFPEDVAFNDILILINYTNA